MLSVLSMDKIQVAASGFAQEHQPELTAHRDTEFRPTSTKPQIIYMHHIRNGINQKRELQLAKLENMTASIGTLLFHEKEEVLCFHGPLLYEAKVLKAEIWHPGDSETGDTGPHYYVHYKGWKSSYDEWVPNERVLKLSQENRDRQKQLKEQYTPKKKKSSMKPALAKPTSEEEPSTNTKKKPVTTTKAAVSKAITAPSKVSATEFKPTSSKSTTSSSSKKSTIESDSHLRPESKRTKKSDSTTSASKKGKEKETAAEVATTTKNASKSDGTDAIDKMHLDNLSADQEINNSKDEDLKDEDKEILEMLEEAPETTTVKKLESGRGRRRKYSETEEASQLPTPEREIDAIGINEPDIDLRIPGVLKTKLVDDWENVTRLNKIITSPRLVTINKILKRWTVYQRAEESPDDKEDPKNLENHNLTENLITLENHNSSNEQAVSPTTKEDGDGDVEMAEMQPEAQPEAQTEELKEEANENFDLNPPTSDANNEVTDSTNNIEENQEKSSEENETANNDQEENNQNTTAENDTSTIIVTNNQPEEEIKDIYFEVVNGLRRYFERAINYNLLYNVEKPYLAELKKNHPNTDLCDIFGAEHLLRLLVKLPFFLAQTDMDQESTQELTFRCGQLMNFMIKNMEEFFPPSPTQYAPQIEHPAKRHMNNNRKGLVCANCKTTNTPGWRVGATQDEKLCNACGLYYSKHKQHRPEHLWGIVRSKRQS
ncbi:975_t:CDS:10 [Ambispora gerdemannii]|uniref:Chromatin modification-related protein EAF3 n=1 Tax=Ambispora gerdemannii TaxID=144530 RepID=A0A9N9FLN0_9GLOM|nr:975_t:CDS:10 [Ambispora gerdemannii]